MKNVPPETMLELASIIRHLPVGHSALSVAGISEWHRKWLAIRYEFIKPAPNPGRGKRDQLDDEMQMVFNEAALAALGLPSDIERHINAGLSGLDPRIFKTIAAAIEAVKLTSTQNTKFSRHCFHALKAAEAIRIESENLGIEPEPHRPRVKMMVVEAMSGDHYEKSDTKRWAEVWEKTGL